MAITPQQSSTPRLSGHFDWPKLPDGLDNYPALEKWYYELQQAMGAKLDELADAVQTATKGEDGEDGKDGDPGKDGITTTITQTIVEQPPDITVGELGLQRQIFIGHRSDNRTGKGTASDPFNGSTPDKFDALFRDKVQEYSDVIILPGVFETKGFSFQDIASSTRVNWRLREGCRLRGCGKERTTVRLVEASMSAVYCVIYGGYAFAVDDPVWNTPGLTTYPWIEVGDLTVDCNWQNQPVQTITTAAGSLYGSYQRIHNVRVINAGSKLTLGGFGIENFILTCNTPAASVDPVGAWHMIIEDCIVEQYQYNGTDGGNLTSIGVLGGDIEVNGTYPHHVRMSRNYVDGKYANGYIPHFSTGYDTSRLPPMGIGLTGGFCVVIEDNTIRNGSFGPYMDTHRQPESIVRGNTWENAWCGVISNFNGNTWPSGKKWGLERLQIYDNDIQLMHLTTAPFGSPGGISLIDFSNSVITTPDTYQFRECYIRGNRISLQDGNMNPAHLANIGIALTHAEQAVIEDNLIKLPTSMASGIARASIYTNKIGRLSARNNRRIEDNSIIVPYDAAKGFTSDLQYEQEKGFHP